MVVHVDLEKREDPIPEGRVSAATALNCIYPPPRLLAFWNWRACQYCAEYRESIQEVAAGPVGV